MKVKAKEKKPVGMAAVYKDILYDAKVISVAKRVTLVDYISNIVEAENKKYKK